MFLVTCGVINLVLLAVYHNRAYPFTTIGGVHVGNMSYTQALLRAQQFDKSTPLTFAYAGRSQTLHLDQLGVQDDTTRTQASLQSSHTWLPIVSLFARHTVKLPIRLTPQQLAAHTAGLDTFFSKAAVNAKVTLNAGTFVATDGQNGYTLNRAQLPEAILSAIDRGQSTITIPTAELKPTITLAQAQITATKLQRTLSTPLTFTYGSATIKPAASDIVAWYAPSGDTYQLNDFAIRTYIANAGVKMGIHAQSLTTAVDTTKRTLADHKAIIIALQPFATTKTYTYCVANRGVVAEDLAGLKTKLASTYSDLRGWSLDGQVVFSYATSNCDFTVWLTASAQMSSFGAICDSYWSCEIGNNVVVNDDRWNQTTDSWKAYGGSVEDYRVMLINHETGHMLGFGHTTCPGTGQPAPIMMQQSIDLQGCVFNIWPVAKELAALRNLIGL